MQPNNPGGNAFCFEGCEKKLFILFKGNGDLRTITKLKWVAILKEANVSILNSMRNNVCIAHLLSESSLFIFKQKIMIKTCGTTTLLYILPIIIKECNKINLNIDHLFYSRSNFLFPLNQPLIHQSFKNETKYLNKYFNGNTHVLGSINKPKFHCYNVSSPRNNNKTLEILLYDLDRKCAKIYFRKNLNRNNLKQNELNKYITIRSGISKLLPSNVLIDSYAFDPCGYSLNGILNDKYWSIHVTPEAEASFVSFETNYNYNDYHNVINNAIKLFKPARFSFAINGIGNDDGDGGFDINKYKFCGYQLSEYSSHLFDKNVACHNVKWSNYHRKGVDNDKDNGKIVQFINSILSWKVLTLILFLFLLAL